MSTDGESSRSPEEESQDSGWMVELIYYNVPGRNDRSRRGKAFRNSTDGELKCFESHDGTKYRPGDHVYIESCSNDPFIIGTISLFKMNKRESLSVKVTRFFRPEEVPEVSISLILQERNELQEAAEPIVDTHPRELFSSESPQSYPISCLRGKCEINFVKDFRSLDGCDLKKSDAFFSCLAYNQESTRLASVQGEIRVGGAFQAKLPPEATCSVGDEPDRDELIYRPGQIAQQTEEKYIKLARSFRMFAMLDQKMPSVEKNARVSDLLFDDCIGTLHRCGYKYDDALKEMNANDKLLAGDANFMTPEDTKKFSKGIKTFGKNFMRISRELLPLHSREQLVAYYYLWKKTPDATKPKPLTRPRNPVAAVKKAKNGNSKASRPASTEYNDYASASESDVEEGKGHHYACHHCYSSDSKDWHHAGRDSMLLCTDCRLFFKKYGQLRPVDRPSTVPPTLFKRSPSTEQEEDSGVRTRAGKHGRRRTPSMGEDHRRSPSQAVSIHEFDLEKTGKYKNGKRKKSHVNGSAKKKKTDDKDRSPEKDEKEIKEEPIERDPSSATPPEDPIQNGHHIKEEDDISESKDVPMEPSTSQDVPVHKSKEEEDSDSDLYDENEDNTWEAGKDIAYESTNATFVRAVVRKVGHRCSRTDLYYRVKAGGAWDKKIKENQEKAKNPAPPPPATAPPTPVQPAKKPEVNGLADPRMPLGMDMQTMHVILSNMHQQAAQAQHQAMIQHEQQQMMVKMELQRQQQAQAMMLQREAQRISGLPFLDSRSLAAVGMIPPGSVGAGGVPPGLDPRMMDALMAQSQMASLIGQHQQQQQLQQMAAAASAASANPMLTAEMLMLNPSMLQAALQQQQQLANMQQQIAMANMSSHPGLAVGSDMMRRLQQEGVHRAFQP